MFFRSEIGESLTLKFADSANQRRSQGLPIISLGLGEPDFDTPPQIIEATIAELKLGTSRYSSPLGVFSLREQVARRLSAENGIPAEASNILMAAGAKQAFHIILMAMLQPSDEVVVVEPAFVSFIPQMYLCEPQCVVHKVDVDRNTFSFPIDEIERKMSKKTRVIVINSPNNPAGYVVPESDLRRLYQLAESYDSFVISDEVYEKLLYENQNHFSIGSLEDSVDRVITINGYSKSHAMTGWRLGYACYPKSLNSKISKIQQHMNTNTCTFVQSAMAAIGSELDTSYLEEYCKILERRRDRVMAVINSCDLISLVSPVSGFFAFIDIEKTGLDSNSFCSSLLEETGVATTPGIAFGKSWDRHIRLSFATKDEILDDGLAKIKDFVQSIEK